MKFCSNCGAVLGEARFCPECGQLAQEEQRMPVQAMDPRQQSLKEMDKMRAYFGAKAERYKELSALGDEIKACNEKTYGGYIGGAIACAVISLMGLWLLWAGVAACIWGMICARKKNNEKLAVATEKQRAVTAELEAHYQNYGYCQIGFEYTSPVLLAVLDDNIRSGRATTLSDAINVMLRDFRDEEMLALQKQMADAAMETAENSREAAKSAKKAANYASASYWW